MKKLLLLCSIFLVGNIILNAQVSKTNATGQTIFQGPGHMDKTFTFTAGDFGGCISLTEVELSLRLIIGNGTPPTPGGYGVHEDLNVRLVSPLGTIVDLVQDRWGYWTGNPAQLNSFHTFPSIDATNDDITISWKPDLCIHAANCVKNLPEVYNPKAKPWIKIENATTEELKAQISTCPSGALSYTEK